MNPERKNKLVFSTQGMYTGQSQTKSILVSLWRTNFKMLSGKWTVLEKTGTAMEACCVKNGLCVITQIINERSQLLLLFFLFFFILTVTAISDHWLQRCLDSTFIIMQHQLWFSWIFIWHLQRLKQLNGIHWVTQFTLVLLPLWQVKRSLIYNKNPSIPSKPITLSDSWEQCSGLNQQQPLKHTQI